VLTNSRLVVRVVYSNTSIVGIPKSGEAQLGLNILGATTGAVSN
jgi:hypothetical protein